jgi:hypothetical protein
MAAAAAQGRRKEGAVPVAASALSRQWRQLHGAAEAAAAAMRPRLVRARARQQQQQHSTERECALHSSR